MMNRERRREGVLEPPSLLLSLFIPPLGVMDVSRDLLYLPARMP